MTDSWTMTRRWAGILIAMMMIAVPASAAVITQNFMRADVSVDAACFTKVAGDDDASSSGFLVFNDAATIQDSSGTVQLFQETMTVRGFAGDRLIYSSAAVFRNDCLTEIEVTFVSENDPANGLAVDPEVVSGVFWDDVDITLHLANTGSPSGLPGSSGDWQAMMSVLGGSVTDQIDSVTIPPNSTRTMGVVVDTDDGVDEAATGTLRWTAQATHP